MSNVGFNISVDWKNRLIAGLVVAALVLSILETASTIAVMAVTGFKASITTQEGEELTVEVKVDDGRPRSLMTALGRRGGKWLLDWFVDGSGVENVTNSISITVTGSNVEGTATVDYYIKAVNASGSPSMKTVEGTGETVTVGGSALEGSFTSTITGHLSDLGLSTSTSQTVDYYVYTSATATGTVSGEPLVTEITETLFDTVEYRYGTQSATESEVMSDSYAVEGDTSANYGAESAWFGTQAGTTRCRYAGRFYLVNYDTILSEGVSLSVYHWYGEYHYPEESFNYQVYNATWPGYINWCWDDQPQPDTVLDTETFVTDPDTDTWRTWSSPELGGYISSCAGGYAYLGIKAQDESLSDTGCKIYQKDHGSHEPYLSFTYVSYAAWYRFPPLTLISLPVTRQVFAAAAAVITLAYTIKKHRERDSKSERARVNGR